MKLTTFILAATMLGAAASAPVSAFAASGDFCRDYTDEAISQAREARSSRFCAREIRREPARWSLNARGHYDWCRVSPRGAAQSQRYYRSDFLRDCQRRRR